MSIEGSVQGRARDTGVAPWPHGDRRRATVASADVKTISPADPSLHTDPLCHYPAAVAGTTGDETAGRAARARDRNVRAAVGAVVGRALEERGYAAVTYPYLAGLAGVETRELERCFSSKADLALAALDVCPGSGSPFGRSGREIVARYLAFWERAGNAVILRELLWAAFWDRRLAAALERHVIATVIRPFAEGNRSTDAYPRARLAFSQLTGLALSRYVLPQEPLASADHETLAAWVGPSLDHYLRGGLGETFAPLDRTERSGHLKMGPTRPMSHARPAASRTTAWTRAAAR